MVTQDSTTLLSPFRPTENSCSPLSGSSHLKEQRPWVRTALRGQWGQNQAAAFPSRLSVQTQVPPHFFTFLAFAQPVALRRWLRLPGPRQLKMT